MLRASHFHPALPALLPIVFWSLTALLTAACNTTQVPGAASPVAPRANPIQGRVYGGQQPLTGATIQLYAAGAPGSGGAFGAGATPLITGTLPTTDNSGNFTITGDYTLPSTPSYFYIVATGGSPGFGNPANPDIVMVATIGGCTAASTLSSSLFIDINEVTTAATILEFASGLEADPFMAAPTGAAGAAVVIGAPAANYNDLRTVFENIAGLVDISSGAVVSPAGSKGQLINTMADILAYCVNSNPSADNHCSNLFATVTPTGDMAAGDTAQAAWYIARNPASHTSALFGLIPPGSPFPALNSAPASFALAAPTDLVACFAVLGGSAVTNTATSATVVSGGDLGIYPTGGAAVTGFTFSTAPGDGVVMAPATVHLADAVAQNAQSDLTTAFNYAAGLANTGSMAADISGLTFTPGVYSNPAAVGLALNSTVTLDALGDADAVFIFQIGSSLTTLAGSQVVLTNNAQAQNVFWQTGTSASLNGSFAGTIMALDSITFPSPITLQGRALASTATVALNGDTVTAP